VTRALALVALTVFLAVPPAPQVWHKTPEGMRRCRECERQRIEAEKRRWKAIEEMPVKVASGVDGELRMGRAADWDTVRFR
jgi:hypothetical protein